jgi:hypothetical protein
MSNKALSDEIQHDVDRRYGSGTPYSSGDFEGMTDEEHGLVLHWSAMLQRNRPEDAMNRLVNKLGGNAYSHAVEHVGDIYHRAQERGGVYGLEYVLPKVRDIKNSLDRPTTFRNNAVQQINSNSAYSKDPSINWDAAIALGKDYATEHSRLPIYNQPAFLATQAAIHLGNTRFGAASEALNQLHSHMDGPRLGWGEEDPEKLAQHKVVWEGIHDNWRGMHSRQAGIDFLKSIGR